MGFKPWHIAVVAVLALLLFGGWKRLPDMARAFGRSMRILKAETKSLSEDDVEAKAEAKYSREPLRPTIEGEAEPRSTEKPAEKAAEKQREH